MGSRGGEKVPALDSRGANFLGDGRQVHLRMRTSRAEFAAHASLLILRMQPVPRQVCIVEGGDILDQGDSVSEILNISRNFFAPEAVDAIRRLVMRFTRSCRADQSFDECTA